LKALHLGFCLTPDPQILTVFVISQLLLTQKFMRREFTPIYTYMVILCSFLW